MQELQFPFYGEPDLSQLASRVGWEFLKLCRGETRKPPTEVAKSALNLCLAVEAAQALVAGKDIEDIAAVESISPVRRRMLIAESARRDRDISRYEAIANYAFRHRDVVENIASGKREPNPEELEQLREHFASLSLILAEVNL